MVADFASGMFLFQSYSYSVIKLVSFGCHEPVEPPKLLKS